MRAVVAAAAVLGGLCWLVAFWSDPFAWVGTVFLAVAVVGAGAGLVSRSATWLRAVVGICFLALVGSVLQVLRDNADDGVVLAVGGLVAAAAGVVVLTRRSPAAHRGAHAA